MTRDPARVVFGGSPATHLVSEVGQASRRENEAGEPDTDQRQYDLVELPGFVIVHHADQRIHRIEIDGRHPDHYAAHTEGERFEDSFVGHDFSDPTNVNAFDGPEERTLVRHAEYSVKTKPGRLVATSAIGRSAATSGRPLRRAANKTMALPAQPGDRTHREHASCRRDRSRPGRGRAQARSHKARLLPATDRSATFPRSRTRMPLAAAASAMACVASNWPGDASAAMREAMLTVDPNRSPARRMTGPWFSAARVSGRRGSFRHACNSVPSAWIATFRLGKREHRLVTDPFDRRLIAAQRFADHAFENLEHVDCVRISVHVRDGAEAGKVDECDGGRCAGGTLRSGSYRCPSGYLAPVARFRQSRTRPRGSSARTPAVTTAYVV